MELIASELPNFTSDRFSPSKLHVDERPSSTSSTSPTTAISTESTYSPGSALSFEASSIRSSHDW